VTIAARLCHRRWIIASAGLVVVALGATAFGLGGQAPADRGAPASLLPYVYGPRHCANCHDQDNHPTYSKSERDAMICRMNEFPIFDVRDRHRRAYSALTGRRGKEMGRLLGTDVLKIAACLNCHGAAAQDVQTQQYTAQSDGVTCVSCHGAFADWVERHARTNNREWRELSRQQKEDRYGMADLWNPARRALVCASCHIGNHDEGKVVTHAMYAAGHPPLPSFEAATFSDAQPRHWEYLREKENTVERWQRLKPAPARNNLEQTQLVVISALVSLRESTKLFAAEATSSKTEPSGARWPNFARFDCYACHHELQAANGASWRQVVRREAAPGRPLSREWPSVLMQLGIVAASEKRAEPQIEQLEKDLTAFHQSVDQQPFGTSECAVRARAVAASASALLNIHDQTTFEPALARKLLTRLCDMANGQVADYESARQIAWAFRIVYHEMTSEGKRDAFIEQALADLERHLFLDLASKKMPAEIETALPDRLKTVVEYDPEFFRARFEKIAARL
jgi:hypothetical protein